MFIRKKTYQDKLDLIDAYKARCDRYREEIYKLKLDKENLNGLNDSLERRIKILELNQKGIDNEKSI